MKFYFLLLTLVFFSQTLLAGFNITIDEISIVCTGSVCSSNNSLTPQCASIQETECGYEKVITHKNGGGLVSECAIETVSADAEIDAGSIVCGSPTIGPNVIIRNHSKITGSIKIYNSTVTSSVLSGARKIKYSTVLNSTISGSGQINHSKINKSKIAGARQIKYSTILNSNISGSSQVKYSKINKSKVSGARQIKYSTVLDSNISGSGQVTHSNIRQSEISGSDQISKSTIDCNLKSDPIEIGNSLINTSTDFENSITCND